MNPPDAGTPVHKQEFERAVAALDQSSINRLRLMRRSALADAAPPRLRLAPGLAFAAGVVAVALAWRTTPPPAAPVDSPVAGVEDPIGGLPSEEDAMLYAWLGEAPVALKDGQAL